MQKAQALAGHNNVFQTHVSKKAVLQTVSIILVGDRSSGTYTTGTTHEITLGAGVGTASTQEAQAQQIAAMLFHELVHVEVSVGDPASQFVTRFAAFSAKVGPALAPLQGDGDAFVDACRVVFRQNHVEHRDTDIAALKADLLSFLTSEAFVYREEQTAFPNVVPRTLQEHLRHDLEGRMQAFYDLGRKMTDASTFVAARNNPNRKLVSLFDGLASKAAASIQSSQP